MFQLKKEEKSLQETWAYTIKFPESYKDRIVKRCNKESINIKTFLTQAIDYALDELDKLDEESHRIEGRQ